jgi:NAD kinase
MNVSQIENVVIVRSKTRLEQLTEKFNTKAQAKFYIQQNVTNVLQKKSKVAVKKEEVEKSFNEYEEEHNSLYSSLGSIHKSLSKKIKYKEIDRTFLSNFIFTEKDLVVVIGQDGLVANTAKYVNNIPIIGVNPDPNQYDGVLLPFNTSNFEHAIENVLSNRYQYKEVTMAEAKMNDGQRLLAFNDFYIGPTSHVSARYQISFQNISERHSSSGIIVSTGAGSTGWMSSVFNMAQSIMKNFGHSPATASQQMPWDAQELMFVVREPFLSKTSQVQLTAGLIKTGQELTLESFMPGSGVIFSDGLESDFLQFNSGAIATIGIAPEKAKLVIV